MLEKFHRRLESSPTSRVTSNLMWNTQAVTLHRVGGGVEYLWPDCISRVCQTPLICWKCSIVRAWQNHFPIEKRWFWTLSRFYSVRNSNLAISEITIRFQIVLRIELLCWAVFGDDDCREGARICIICYKYCARSKEDTRGYDTRG